ncbi:hypothetical protein ACQP2U_23375 [Nocardia sp. CA-084685]|uniref:hypothetical protein n=1 Tax=Nocardia sp. CA-084685 TaxID=3239970 RepID=UPI003D99A6F5
MPESFGAGEAGWFVPDALPSLRFQRGRVLDFHTHLTNAAGDHYPWGVQVVDLADGLRSMLSTSTTTLAAADDLNTPFTGLSCTTFDFPALESLSAGSSLRPVVANTIASATSPPRITRVSRSSRFVTHEHASKFES